MSTISNNYSETNYYYKPASKEMQEMAVFLATTATGLVYKALPPFSNPFLKQMSKEHANNHLYKDIFDKAVENSGLNDIGLKIIDYRVHKFDLLENKISNESPIGSALLGAKKNQVVEAKTPGGLAKYKVLAIKK